MRHAASGPNGPFHRSTSYIGVQIVERRFGCVKGESANHRPTYHRMMRTAPPGLVPALIGAATAGLWIRLGLYGFGLPIGLLTLIPSALLGVRYARERGVVDLGMLLGSFAAVWTAFEAWTWFNAATDPGVVVPDWTPIPFAAAIVLLLLAGGLAAVGLSTRSRLG